MYLREMGTVPLPDARGRSRRSRGASSAASWPVIKSILAHPLVAKEVIELGDSLPHRRAHDPRAGDLQRRGDHRRAHRRALRQVQKQIDAVRKARAVYEKLDEKLAETPKGATTRDKRKYRRPWAAMRAASSCRQSSAKIEFTEAVKRALIDG
jgi:hypothetical protein